MNVKGIKVTNYEVFCQFISLMNGYPSSIFFSKYFANVVRDINNSIRINIDGNKFTLSLILQLARNISVYPYSTEAKYPIIR